MNKKTKKENWIMWNRLTSLWSSVVDHVKVKLHCWNCLESLVVGVLGVALWRGCVSLEEALGLLLVGKAVKHLLHK